MSNIFTHLSYSGDTLTPTLHTTTGKRQLLGFTGTLSFDTAQRYCVGWHDLADGINHPCPDNATTSNNHDTCIACQKRTGFNPAFYNAAHVSPQQIQRNNEPHILYIAYMGDGYCKVGISWAQRGIRRLLDQGARAGIIVDTFPTALIARQYEAKIARLPHFHETTTTHKKLQLLERPYSEAAAKQALIQACEHINQQLGVRFSADRFVALTPHYTQPNTTLPHTVTTLTEPRISGTLHAIIGDIAIARHEDRFVALPLKQFTGYPIVIDDQITPLDLPAEQISLF